MQAGLLVLGAIATMLVTAVLVSSAGAPPIVVVGAGEVGLAVLPLAYALRRGDLGLLGLRLPRARFVVAAILVGASFWYVNALVVELVFPSDAGKGLEKLVTEPPLALVLACAAILPAIAEEVVFRGLLARSLANRLPVAAAAVISAAVFAAYHFNLVQALPTFTLGLALAYITLRADSILPAMIAHAINNTIAIVLTRMSPSQDTGIEWNAAVAVSVAISLALTTGGLALAGRGAA
jgi:membrane protease YdiL (CAAX protease family)